MAYGISSAVIVKKLGLAANGSVVLPKGFTLLKVTLQNTTSNSVTGGIRIGTTGGGSDVVLAQAVGSSAIVDINPTSALLKQTFSFSSTQSLFIEAITSWNSASLDMYFIGYQLINPN